MKIIAGKFKGRNIRAVKNATYRPSTAKFKEAVFNILASMGSDMGSDILQDAYVLDLFAGTGGLAFEALSRGAARATLIDIEPRHIKAAAEFSEDIGATKTTTFLRLDACNLPDSHYKYDLVFIDPPYMKAMANKALRSLHERGWLKNGSIVVVELAIKEDLAVMDFFNTTLSRVYGGTKLIILEYIGGA